ncbi:MAG TPA: DUF5671 domain-containing protein [Candidatus Limnocylindria bacterium]|jgi:hypothetical protein|nr:DUF5671 domain-containing protein [Candidatus Limnocylindria bacterium]
MTLLGVLAALAVLGGLVLLAVLFAQRGREGLDLSPAGLLRIYLYLGSLAGVVVFSVGLAGILAYVLAAGFGLDVMYGGAPPQPLPAVVAPCPPNQAACTPAPVPVLPPDFKDDRLRRQGEDLVRGVTFGVFGAVFWGAHWWARRALARSDEQRSGLYRAYLMLGTAIFGIATIALLPMGVYQALSLAIVPSGPYGYRPGAGDALSGGLGALPLWLAYLWFALRTLRSTPPPASV